MSQNNAEHGDFALSVKQSDIVHHIEIKVRLLILFEMKRHVIFCDLRRPRGSTVIKCYKVVLVLR